MDTTPPLNPRTSPRRKALTVKGILNLQPGRYAAGVPGLYIFVEPSGAKRWVLRTVILGAGKDGRPKRCDLGIGSANLVTLAEARDEASRLRKLARAGGDPRAERRRAQRLAAHPVPTFEMAAADVFKAHTGSWRSAQHRAQWLSSLTRHIFPTLGALKVDAITSAEVLKALEPVWTKRPETARRLKQRIKAVLDWAKASGFRTGDNPTEGLTQVLPKHRGKRRHHAALSYQAVPAFLLSLRAADTGVLVKLAFELLILTATRTSEVLGARWEEVDLEAKTWTIPGARMKAGREHRVPLSPRAVEIVTQAQTYADGSPFVFPGRRPEKSLSTVVFHKTLRRLGRNDITVHGFRSSFRDWAEEKTHASRAVCEAALAHMLQDKTEAAYRRTDLFEPRRELMSRWSAFATAAPADVVDIRSGAGLS